MNVEPLQVTLIVTQTLERLGIPYFLGGSLASALHGEPRSTLDADIVADLQMEHVEPLVNALAPDMYIDARAVPEAIRARSSFNLIHYATMFKVDVFVRKRRLFDDAQFARRAEQIVLRDPDRRAQVASPEDSILAKLEWYRMGGAASERQWRDILGMLQAQGERLDRSYMERMAGELAVSDLLSRAWAEAGLAA